MSSSPYTPPLARGPLEPTGYPDHGAHEPDPPPSARVSILIAALVAVLAAGIYFWLPRIQALANELLASGQGVADVATLPMPFESPRVSAPLKLPGAAPLHPAAQEVLALRRAFFAGEFDRLEQGLTALRENSRVPSRASVPFSVFLDSLDDTVMAGLDRCNQWLSARPNSYFAHWTCAKLWNSGAWDVRTGAYASRLSQAQAALMRERMLMSNRLLEQALPLDPAPFEALSQLGHNHFVLGTGLGHHYLNQAESIEPRYVSMHRQRIHFSQPQWGGSLDAVGGAIERARLAGLDEDDLLFFNEHYLVRPEKMATPGAGRDYWIRMLDEKVLQHRFLGLLQELGRVNNWKTMVPVAEKMILHYPGDPEGHQWLAQALLQTGQTDRAREAMLTAAALGSDHALEELILAHIRGGMGIQGGELEPMVEICRYAAAIGSKVGGNCMGAGSFEGISPDIPFEHDPAQGYAWHLLAARGGHYNSQFDLGWMLYTGRVPGVSLEDAQSYGIYWLRRAAEKKHRFAGARLDELGISRSEWVVPDFRTEIEQLVLQGRVLLGSLAARLAELNAL